MNKIDLTEIDELIITNDLVDKNVGSIMYIQYNHGDTEIKIDYAKLRNLKLGEFLDNEDNGDEIKEVQKGTLVLKNDDAVYSGGGGNAGSFANSVVTPSVQVSNITLTNSVDRKEFTTDKLRRKILDEIYKVSDLHKNNAINNKPPLDLDFTNTTDVLHEEISSSHTRKIISRILMCSNFIAINGRIGPATHAIIGDKVLQRLMAMNQLTPPPKGSKSKIVGTLSGVSVIHDKQLKDKIVVYRIAGKLDSCGDNLSLHYNIEEDKFNFEILSTGLVYNNYISFEVKGL